MERKAVMVILPHLIAPIERQVTRSQSLETADTTMNRIPSPIGNPEQFIDDGHRSLFSEGNEPDLGIFHNNEPNRVSDRHSTTVRHQGDIADYGDNCPIPATDRVR